MGRESHTGVHRSDDHVAPLEGAAHGLVGHNPQFLGDRRQVQVVEALRQEQTNADLIGQIGEASRPQGSEIGQ